MDAKVGGCCGCFTSSCKAKITFEKKLYFMGDTAKVHVECDNSACKKDVESIKLILERKHWAKDSLGDYTSGKARIADYKI